MKNFPIISFLFPPRMRSGRTLTDKRMEAIALLLLLMLWGMTVYFYHVLLGQIPVNFDIHGHVDRYGSKSALFLISGIFTFISLILGVCAYHPRLINLPVAYVHGSNICLPAGWPEPATWFCLFSMQVSF